MPWSDADKKGTIPDDMRSAANRVAYAVLFAVAALGIAAGVLLQIWLSTPPALPAAPVVYSQYEYTPIKRDVCIGGSLEADITRTIRQTTRVAHQAKWYDRAQNRLLLTEPKAIDPVTPDGGVTHRFIPVPPALTEPAEMELRQFIWEVDGNDNQASKIAVYVIPFRLVRC